MRINRSLIILTTKRKFNDCITGFSNWNTQHTIFKIIVSLNL